MASDAEFCSETEFLKPNKDNTDFRGFALGKHDAEPVMFGELAEHAKQAY